MGGWLRLSDGDFYVEDESPQDVRAAWRRGEKGITKGPRELSSQANPIVDRAVAQLDGETRVIRWVVGSAVDAQEAETGTSNVTRTDQSLAHA
jgi:hypothetical protein